MDPSRHRRRRRRRQARRRRRRRVPALLRRGEGRRARTPWPAAGSTRCASASTTWARPSSSPSDVPGGGPRRRPRHPARASVTGDAAARRRWCRCAGRPFIDWQARRARGVGRRPTSLLLVGHARSTRSATTSGAASPSASRSRTSRTARRCSAPAARSLHALPLLPDAFWVTYGDTLLDVDLAAAEQRFDDSGCRRAHDRAPQPLTSGNRATCSSTGGYVVDYGKSPPPAGAEHIDYGMLLFHGASWDCRDAEEVFDLADVLRPLIRSRGRRRVRGRRPLPRHRHARGRARD